MYLIKNSMIMQLLLILKQNTVFVFRLKENAKYEDTQVKLILERI